MRSRTFLFLILTFVLMVPSVIHSVTVTQTTAEQIAMNWYAERNEKNPTEFEIIETITEKENAENIFYIFNFDKTGFVIVSADDIAVPILGYVFEHNYTTEN
ncbi:MAG: Spi family protease inhibitor, partial [Candidatus Tenebribacter burtonii]|nr:Spi family protease inhibitor [Candidatus Tenebribacter burtonii]